MNKYLTDSEILSWNDRLEGSNIGVYPTSGMDSNGQYTSYTNIRFVRTLNQDYYTTGKNGLLGNTFEDIPDPTIKFKYSISIVKNRLSFFEDLLNKFMETPLKTKASYNGDSEIIDLSEIRMTREEKEHQIKKKTYIRYTYNFNDKLSKIIGYISYIEDTINAFNSIWQYDEDGNEKYLLKYKIGDIVSIIEDKSRDFLILDYIYMKRDNKYDIGYTCSEILDTNSLIIKYGTIFSYQEKDLCYSRNNRIDNILN